MRQTGIAATKTRSRRVFIVGKSYDRHDDSAHTASTAMVRNEVSECSRRACSPFPQGPRPETPACEAESASKLAGYTRIGIHGYASASGLVLGSGASARGS